MGVIHMNDRSNTLTVIAIILGFVACILGWFPSVWLGIIAVICGIVGIAFAAKGMKDGVGGVATFALVICIIGLCCAIVGTIVCGICTGGCITIVGNNR